MSQEHFFTLNAGAVTLKFTHTITGVAEKFKLGSNDVDELIVNRGPGSYTGVRIALSVVRTTAQVLKLPIRCVNSLEVLPSCTSNGALPCNAKLYETGNFLDLVSI